MIKAKPQYSNYSIVVTFAYILLLVSVSVAYFSFLQSIFFVPVALISFELIASLFLVKYIGPYIFGFLYISLISIHTLFVVAPAYHMSLSSAGNWILSILDLPLQEKYFIVMIATVFAGLAIFVSIKIMRVSQSSKLINWSVFVLLGVSIVTDRLIEPIIGRNLVDSDTLSLAKVYRTDSSDFEEPSNTKINSASSVLFESLSNNSDLPKKILFVMAESFGFADEHVNKLQYIDLVETRLKQHQSKISFSKVKFEGSTIPGEYRELCQRNTSNPILSIPSNIRENCLVRLLSERGYSTASYHGFGGGFFDRVRLYDEIGFDQSFFAAALKKSFKLNNTCGYLIFEGLCDSDVAAIIKNKLVSTDKPEFIYWLTLNAHQPSLGSPHRGDYANCSEMNIIEGRLCWIIQHSQVTINSVLDIAVTQPDIAIIIVGDHSPGAIKETFSKEYVPVITIWPSQ